MSQPATSTALTAFNPQTIRQSAPSTALAVFNPEVVLQPAHTGEEAKPYISLILLYRSLSQKRLFFKLWDICNWNFIADGAANKLYHTLGPGKRGDKYYIPDCIVGDFDSIRPEVYNFYQERDVDMVHDPDQYSTDLEKALIQAETRFSEQLKPGIKHVHDVAIYASLGSRVDHGIGILHELLRETRHEVQGYERRVWLITEMNVSWVLRPGVNVISSLSVGMVHKHDVRLFRPKCGILPVYGPSVITTDGLQWDVKDWNTEMGGKVSSSNKWLEDKVVIATTNWVLFTVEINVNKLPEV